MGATSSNLSAAAWGYDLVCAVTQDGINGTMLELLDGSNQEFSACYTQNDQNLPVAISLTDLIAQTGVDPFDIPNGTDQSSPDLQKLNDASFWYAFKAKLGIPDLPDLTQVPDVIILDQGNSQLTYQLFCAEFTLVVMNYQPHNHFNFTNITQPPGQPWTFVFRINMDLRSHESAYSQLPAAAQARISNLDPNTMFSVQQLLVDVSTRGMQTLPIITGLDSSSPAYIALTQDFINTYWDHVAPGNSILLGYSVAPVSSNLSITPSIVPTALNFEIDQYSDASQRGLNTLNYLVMSNNSAMPPAVPFTWDWVDAADDTNFHGVMAVRRNVFSAFLASLIQPDSAVLSVDTTVSMTHSGLTFYTSLSAPTSSSPAQWVQTAAGTAADSDGYTKLLTINYSHESYDDSLDSSHLSSINGNFNYTLTGDISVSGTIIRLTLHAVAYCEFNAHIYGIQAANFNANIVDLSSVVSYTMSTTPQGAMQVTASPASAAPTDNSQDIDVSTWDSMIGLGGVADMIRTMRTTFTQSMINTVTSVDNEVAQLLNGSGGWVYPGGKTFFFKDVAFSVGQDLVSRVTYVDPSQGTPSVTVSDSPPPNTSARGVPPSGPPGMQLQVQPLITE